MKSGVANNFLVGDISDSKNDFGIRFSGFIEIPEDGLYYFRCRADDAGSLKIHDTLVCLDGKSEVDEVVKELMSKIGFTEYDKSRPYNYPTYMKRRIRVAMMASDHPNYKWKPFTRATKEKTRDNESLR